MACTNIIRQKGLGDVVVAVLSLLMSGEQLRQQRTALGLSQQQLAEALIETARLLGLEAGALDRTRVNKWETEVRRPAALYASLLQKTFERLGKK